MSRTLIDISLLGTDTTWPSVATEVTGYLQNWIAAANAQVNQHQPVDSGQVRVPGGHEKRA